MSDIKATIKDNLIRLRHESGLTQLELSGKINYSDKAISRWETGEVTPDIETLAALASLYEVPIETFFRTEEEQAQAPKGAASPVTRKRALLALSICVVWAVVLTLFFIFFLRYAHAWCILLWGIPASMLLLAVYFHTTRHTVTRTVFLSLLLWSALVTTYLQIGIPAFFPILFIGIPFEAGIIIFPFFTRKK